MPRRGLLAGTWALATIAATLVGWAAVQQVTAEVSPPRVLPFPTAAALAAPTPTPPAEQPPSPPPPAPTATAGVTPEPATEAEPALTEGYELVGGVVTVRYAAGVATLVSATPSSGFRVEVRDEGPEEVDVRFRSDGHESRFVTRWRDGAPRPERDERSR